MKTVKFLCSVANDKYQGGKGAILELDDYDAYSEVRAGNAEFIDLKDIPQGLQTPKRKPIIDEPEVHTTIIQSNVAKVKKSPAKKKPAKK